METESERSRDTVARRLEKVLKESGICLEHLAKECTEDKLLGLSEHCDSLTVVGFALGLSKIQINDVERDYKTSEEKRVGLMLKWKESSGFKATYQRFVEALLTCGRKNAATEVCRGLAKETETEVEPASGKTAAPSSMVVTEHQSEQLHDTLSPSTGEQGPLKSDTAFNEEPSQHTPQIVEPPTTDETRSLPPPPPDTGDPPSNDGPSDHLSLEEDSPGEECSSLKLKVKELENEYQLIGEKLTDALEESAVTLNILQKYVANLPMSVRRCYEELRTNTLPTEMENATSIGKFLGVLNNYSNFLNPALLADAVKRFGDIETKSLLKTYNDKLNEFEKTTTLVQFVTECMYEEDLPEGYVEIELVMKSNWEQKTLRDIKPPKRSWLLNKVYFGSLRVVFSIPDVSDLKEEGVQEFLRSHVKQVLVNGECILDLESQDQEAVSGHAPLGETRQLIEGHTQPKDVNFRFSDKVTGKNIILSDDGLEARRRDIYNGGDGGVYIATPLSGRFALELEVHVNSGFRLFSLEIGVAQCPKGSYQHLDIPYRVGRNVNPRDGCFWSDDKVFNNLDLDGVTYTDYGTVNLHDLQEGDTVAMEISESGDFSFYVNGAHQGVAARGLYREDKDLYPAVFVDGRVTGVRITRAVMSGCVCPAEDQRRPLEKTTNHIQYGFNPVAGKNIVLLDGDMDARRSNPDRNFSGAVVYGSRPLNRRSKFEVEISEKGSGWGASIRVGVVRLPTGRGLSKSDIPEYSERGDNHCVWRDVEVWNRRDGDLDRRRYGSINLDNLGEGDTVGMRVACDGSLSFFVNGRSQGLALKGLLKDGYDVYPVVDVCWDCHAVRITRAESHPEDQVVGLQELCLEKIASCLDWSSEDVNLLPLPPRQKDQLKQYCSLIDYL